MYDNLEGENEICQELGPLKESLPTFLGKRNEFVHAYICNPTTI